jgi:hypothetical protein
VTPGTPRGVLAAAAAQVENFFLEPLPAGEEDSPAPVPGAPLAPVPAAPPQATALRPVIAVFGLARRCGATVVARGLAAELAGRDQAGVAAVASPAAVGGIPLATPAAGRLAGALEDVPGARTTAVGRLCLVEGADARALADTARWFAPLVIDAGGVEVDSAAAAVADRVLLVAGPGVEPALAQVASDCVRRLGPEPLVVRNRAGWNGSAGLPLPDSRMGAQLALGGRQARGELGRAIAALADLCGAAA